MANGAWEGGHSQLTSTHVDPAQTTLTRDNGLMQRNHLDEGHVYAIRSMAAVWGMSNADIGRWFALPRETVRDIVNRKTWNNLPASTPENVELWAKEMVEWDWHVCPDESLPPGAEHATDPQAQTAGAGR